MRVGAAGHRQPQLHRARYPRHLFCRLGADVLLQAFAAEIEAVLDAPDQPQRFHPLQTILGDVVEMQYGPA